MMKRALLIALLCICNAHANYAPQLTLDYKGGHRHIGRISGLIPVWQQGYRLAFVNAIAALGTKSVGEGNLGFGYRQQMKIMVPSIVGVYGYYDIRRTQNKNTLHQLTIGAELLNTLGEARINGYMPIAKNTFFVSATNGVSHDAKNIFFGKTKLQEKSLGGFDAEVGARILKLPINAYIGGYYFNSKDVESIVGPSIRIEYKPYHWLNVGGEYSYDKKREHQYFVNVGVRYSFGGKGQVSPFSLQGKMTQMPVRDIDIVDTTYEDFGEAVIAKQVKTVAELEAALTAGEKNIAITGNIDYQGQVIAIHGTIENPIKDTQISGVQVTKQGSNITGVHFHRMQISNYKLPAPDASNTLILAGRQYFAPQGFFEAMQDSSVSYLTVADWQVNAAHDAAAVIALAGGGTIPFAAGLIGHANNVEISYNKNVATISSGLTAGLVGLASNSRVSSNTNSGPISGQDAAGIVGSVDDNSTVSLNANNAPVTGTGAFAIIDPANVVVGASAVNNTDNGNPVPNTP